MLSPADPPLTVLLRDWATGSADARDQLMALVYQELKRISAQIVQRERDPSITATALVHDLFVRLAGSSGIQWNDRRHFFAFCARLMRRIVIDQARERMTEKRSAVIVPLGLEEIPWIGHQPSTYLDLDRALEELAEAEPEKARVVELRVYLGCTADETAEILGISKATVDRHLAFARAWLFRALQANRSDPTAPSSQAPPEA